MRRVLTCAVEAGQEATMLVTSLPCPLIFRLSVIIILYIYYRTENGLHHHSTCSTLFLFFFILFTYLYFLCTLNTPTVIGCERWAMGVAWTQRWLLPLGPALAMLHLSPRWLNPLYPRFSSSTREPFLIILTILIHIHVICGNLLMCQGFIAH